MKDRAELDEEIDALAAWMPTMLAETDEASQMDAFAAHVRDRLQRILVEHCLVPADEGPCG